jgi:hypothetical protein
MSTISINKYYYRCVREMKVIEMELGISEKFLEG